MSSHVTQARLPCPKCPSSDAYHIYSDGHGHCFSCNYHKPREGEELGVSYTYEYLPLRGLTKRTLEFYNILTKIDNDGKPVSIGFKYPSGKTKVRSLDEKTFRWEPQGDTSKEGLFGRNLFPAGSHKYVTITEGELDAASLYQVLGSPVVSVHSATSANRDCTTDRSWLNTFERIYLAFDSDGPGRDAARAVAKLFDYNKVLVLDFAPFKDANEYLEADREGDLRNIWYNAKQYLPEEVISITSETAKKILAEPAEPGIAYPFPTLTDMTYGIRKSESVLITAQEGVGKTELMHAIQYKLLQETPDDTAIGAIFLEEPKKRHLQALAGIELKRPVHLPDAGVSEDDILSALARATKKDEKLLIYSHFGSDSPEVILDTIRFMVSARSVGYVLLDHLSMVVSGLSGDDERRALDYISTRLEMMVKELNFSLIFVSHVNDLGQTRGSRYISKVADIRIDADRDLETNSNIINLRVSKNRYSGITGNAGSYTFDPFMRTYTEVAA